MLPFDPFAWFYSFVGYFQELWSRLAPVRRLQQTAAYQRVFGFLLNVSLVRDQQEVNQVQPELENTASGRLGEFFQLLLHSSFVQPFYWLMGLMGLSFEWLISRQWLKITVLSLPAVMLVALAVSAWYGGRIDRRDQAALYLQLGLEEIKAQNAKLNVKGTAEPISTTSGPVPRNAEQAVDETNASRFQYAEILLVRSQLLHPINRWKYLVGAYVLDEGGYQVGRKLLSRLAPDNAKGMPEAHAAVATSYLNQWNRTNEPSLLAPFVHHADAALQWNGTPKEVLVALSSVYWQQGDQDKSFQVWKIAAERYAGLYLPMFEQAVVAGKLELAADLKPKAMEETEEALAADPTNARLRVRLVRMFGTDQSGLTRTEACLREGIDLQPDPLLYRALSEVYRIAFIRQLMESSETQADINLLDLALQVDPSNPLVSDQISRLVTGRQRPLDELSDSLVGILASGNATIGTHAILAELRMHQGNTSAELHHLEQVFQAAPQAAKYANRLMQIYISQGKAEEAVSVGINSLSILDKNGLLRETFVDDLLHTVGMLFFQLGRNDDALSALENALKANPNRIDTRTELARFYRSVGKENQALVHEEYLAKLPKSLDSTPGSDPGP